MGLFKNTFWFQKSILILKIAILQPTPFKKGHYFIYTKSLLENINNKYFVRVISALKTIKKLDKENSSKIDFNIYSFNGLIIYLTLCYLSIFRFIFSRNKFNRLIILDCEYSCVSLLFLVLYFLRWEGKVTLQVNAPNFDYRLKEEGLRVLLISLITSLSE